ncbi:MAG: DUF1311 domain-containing protein [Lachnospiraceae bacterium]|nr:DUF1311 domain-containing protein [Lachnospiraceae bacterium]
MKKILLTSILGAILAISIAGCGVQEPEDIYSVPGETIESVQTEQNVTESNISEADKAEAGTLEQEVTGTDNAMQNVETPQKNTEEQTKKELTFADLSKLQFEFASGVGAWSEEFTIEKDGYFQGKFHDANMGITGEGYENGSYYFSSYSGHFTELSQINEYTYQMKLADISYEEVPGTEEINDNMLFIYTETCCLGETDTFTIYLPGTPMEELSEEVKHWLFAIESSGPESGINNSEKPELAMVAIVNEAKEYGIYSYERLAPLEDAQMTYNTYKESYDYYGEKLSEAGTTAEMVEYTAIMYEYSDDCLNYIWNLIRYNVEEAKYQELLTEQRAWIQEKEDKAKEAAAEYEGGSLAAVTYNDTLAQMTIERCAELVEYLK